jgi:putative ABC transport system permease protein
VTQRINGLGTTLLQIIPARVVQAGVETATLRRITPDDAKAIADRAPHVTEIQPQQNATRQVIWKDKNTNVQITGTTPNFLEVRKFVLDRGRMLTESDESVRRRVAVLGAGVLPLLEIPDADAILGETIRIAGEQFTVVGVLAQKGESSSLGNSDEQVLIPFATGRAKVFGNDLLNGIFVLSSSEDDIPVAMAEVESAVRRSHHLRARDPDDFQIRDQSDYLTTLNETTTTFTLLLAGIGSVSLLVGGIGIMNIMLVSVTERTHEIGIRKALGATRVTILGQFLAQAVVFCAAGGMLGVLAGIGATVELHRAMGWITEVDASSVALALGFAAGTGLLFGVWPAKRAAAMDPIEALRYE